MQVKDFVDTFWQKKDIINFKPGDTVKITLKVYEDPQTERTQGFEGVVISKRSSGLDATFTVRKISFGIGVERTFPLYSPNIEKIELIKSGKVRRAKLFYLRKLTGRASKIKEEQPISTDLKAKTELKTLEPTTLS